MTTLTQHLDPATAAVIDPIVDVAPVRLLLWLVHFIETVTLMDFLMLVMVAATFCLIFTAVFDILFLEPARVKKNKRSVRRR